MGLLRSYFVVPVALLLVVGFLKECVHVRRKTKNPERMTVNKIVGLMSQ